VHYLDVADTAAAEHHILALDDPAAEATAARRGGGEPLLALRLLVKLAHVLRVDGGEDEARSADFWLGIRAGPPPVTAATAAIRVDFPRCCCRHRCLSWLRSCCHPELVAERG
jgi:hypothetical protein